MLAYNRETGFSAGSRPASFLVKAVVILDETSPRKLTAIASGLLIFVAVLVYFPVLLQVNAIQIAQIDDARRSAPLRQEGSSCLRAFVPSCFQPQRSAK